MLPIILTGNNDTFTAALTQLVRVAGGLGNDTITGGNLDDELFGDEGNDRLLGGLGADMLSGGVGNDYLAGGAGNDTIFSGGGNDTILGDDGNDLIWLGSTVAVNAPTTTVNGGLGADTVRLMGSLNTPSFMLTAVETFDFNGFDLIGGTGNDTVNLASATTIVGARLIQLNAGNDRFTGSAGADSVAGGIGNDTFTAGAGNDMIDGGEGNDSMLGGDGNDMLVGGLGNDTLNGQNGDDTLVGGGGNDSFDGGLGNDELRIGGGAPGAVGALNGASGTDRLVFQGSIVDASFSLLAIEEINFNGHSLAGTAAADTFSLASAVTVTGAGQINLFAGNDSFRGSQAADTVDGGIGNDSLDGGAGHDALFGDAGNDTLLGGAGDDWLVGGAGNDSLNGDVGSDTVSYAGSAAAVTVTLTASGGTATGEGTDTFGGIENVIGTGLGDTMNGSTLANRLEGGSGDDQLFGNDGADTLEGGVGADRLVGGAGADRLVGGAGADIFGFRGPLASQGVDLVFDFSVVDDTLEIDASDFGGGLVAGGTVHLVASASPGVVNPSATFLYNTMTGALSFDADGVGSGAAVQFATLVGAPMLTTADFLIVA